MFEALWFGFVASLAFIGFMSIVCYIILHIYPPRKYCRFVMYIPDNITEDELHSLMYGSYLRNALCGDILTKDIIILSDNTDVDNVLPIVGIPDCSFKIVSYDNFLSAMNQED